MRSKFYGITFPLIGLKHAPYDYVIRSSSISIKLSQQSDWITLDQFTDGKSVIARYIMSKPEDFLSDATCLSLTQLINKKLQWGIDSTARIFNLAQKQTFKARSVCVVKTKEDLIWVDTVSYPFKIKKSLLDSNLILEQYATIVYIDGEWVLSRFTPFKQDIQEIQL